MTCRLALCHSWPGCWAPEGPSRGALSSGILQSGEGEPTGPRACFLLSSVTFRSRGGLWRGGPGGPSQLLHPLLAKLLKTGRGVEWGPTQKWQKLVGRPEGLPKSRRQQPCKGKEGKISSKQVSETPCRSDHPQDVGDKSSMAQGWGRCSQGGWTPEWEPGPAQQCRAGPR